MPATRRPTRSGAGCWNRHRKGPGLRTGRTALRSIRRARSRGLPTRCPGREQFGRPAARPAGRPEPGTAPSLRHRARATGPTGRSPTRTRPARPAAEHRSGRYSRHGVHAQFRQQQGCAWHEDRSTLQRQAGLDPMAWCRPASRLRRRQQTSFTPLLARTRATGTAVRPAVMAATSSRSLPSSNPCVRPQWQTTCTCRES